MEVKKLFATGAAYKKMFACENSNPPTVKKIMVRPLDYDVSSFVLDSCSYCKRQGEPAILIFR